MCNLCRDAFKRNGVHQEFKYHVKTDMAPLFLTVCEMQKEEESLLYLYDILL